MVAVPFCQDGFSITAGDPNLHTHSRPHFCQERLNSRRFANPSSGWGFLLFPFLGVHFTRRIDGTVEVGPNAVLALGREQYRGSPPVWGDFWETLTNRGFRRLARRHWRAGLREMLSSRSTTLYSRLARRLVPAIRRRHLERGGVGIRAQAIAPDGSLVDDFVIERADSTTHVLNAPSPGATASLAIGRYVAEQIRPMLTRPRPD